MHRPGASLVLALAVLAAAPTASAQSLLLDRGQSRAGWFELAVPSFADSMSGWLAYAGLTYRVGRHFALVAEVPVAHVESPVTVYPCLVGPCPQQGGSRTALGNPYLGIRVGAPLGAMDVEVGFRPRVVKAEGTWLGPSLLDLAAREGDFDRFEAFASNLTTLRTAVTGTARLSPAFTVRGRTTVTFFPGGDGVNAVSIGFGGAVRYAARRLGAGAAITVRKPRAFDSDPSSVQAGFAVDCTLGTVAPSLYVRIPLQEAMAWYGMRSARYIVGIGITVALQGRRAAP
jgi:hypothetical protein